jgi:hypothetical protein
MYTRSLTVIAQERLEINALGLKSIFKYFLYLKAPLLEQIRRRKPEDQSSPREQASIEKDLHTDSSSYSSAAKRGSSTEARAISPCRSGTRAAHGSGPLSGRDPGSR